jgi:hypothetical protein
MLAILFGFFRQFAALGRKPVYHQAKQSKAKCQASFLVSITCAHSHRELPTCQIPTSSLLFDLAFHSALSPSYLIQTGLEDTAPAERHRLHPFTRHLSTSATGANDALPILQFPRSSLLTRCFAAPSLLFFAPLTPSLSLPTWRVGCCCCCLSTPLSCVF